MSTASSVTIDLPRADRSIEPYRLGSPGRFERPTRPLESRIMFAAAHVVADPWGEPHGPAALDWDATLSYREFLWSWGLGVAEAMDTAQRGAGLDWQCARELIRRSASMASACGGRICAGANTDQLPPSQPASLSEIVEAYLEQCELIVDAGAQPVLMASRMLAKVGREPDDYRRVYDSVLSQVSEPVIIHWLGEMFDSQLASYWGTADLDEAATVVVDLIGVHLARVDGIKVSLLDAERELALRGSLPAEVRVYTGDDFHYPELIAGDGDLHSHALLGVLDAIAPAASTAVQALDDGDAEGFERAMLATVPLAQRLFAAPTASYKTGLVFLAYLNGHQPHFHMLGGQQSSRSIVQLSDIFRLADTAGLLMRPDLAAERMRGLLAIAGVDT